MRTQGQAQQREATQFAASHDQAQCFDEAKRRDDVCGPSTEISCHVQSGLFFDACLDAATPTPGICDGVPPSTEIMQSAQWEVGLCQGQPDNGQNCRNLLQTLQ